MPYADDHSGQAVQDLLAPPFELLLGRRTYDIWAAYWPQLRGGSPIAAALNGAVKHVATHRAETLAWHDSHALTGSLADAVSALRRQDGPTLMTWGSGHMVRQLLAAGLVDELRLLVYPVVLGRGKRLFDEHAQASAFTLAHSASTPRGVLVTRHVRSGAVRTGTFAEAG